MLRFCLLVWILLTAEAASFYDLDKDCVMDLAFLIDDSSTIATFANATDEEANWNLIINFLQTLVRELNVGPSSTRIAAVSFGSTTRINFFLNQWKTKQEVVTGISNISYRGEPSPKNPTLGLSEIRRLFNQTYGDRPDVPNVVVIITEHVNDTEIAELMNETQLLKDLGTSIICIEFKPFSDMNTTVMQRVVTAPPSYYYFGILRMSSLIFNVDDVAVATCSVVRNPRDGCVMDLAFLIDHSSNIAAYNNGSYSAQKWKLILGFFQNVVETLDVGPSTTHVASIIVAGNRATYDYDFLQDQTKETIVVHIGNIENTEEPADGNPETGLRSMKYRVFNTSFGDRSATPNVLVLLTREVSNKDMIHVKYSAEILKYLGTSLIWIGVSDAINATAMKLVVTPPSSENFFPVSRLESLNAIVSDTAVAACRAARNRQNGCVMDLAFLIDHSSCIATDDDGNYSDEKWNLILNFFQRIVDTLDVGPSATHVAAITFGGLTAVHNFDLNQGQTKDKVVTDIGDIEYEVESDDKSPVIALGEVKKRVFNTTHGDRSAVPNVVIIITEEVSEDHITGVTLTAETMKYLGTSVICIAVSKDINATAMKLVVTAPSSENFFAVTRLEYLKDYVDDVAAASCRAAKNQQNDCVMDLTFLIDNSRSIASYINGKHHARKWNLVLSFFQNVVETLDVGPSATHVASFSFAKRTTDMNFDLNEWQTKDQVVSAIGSITHDNATDNPDTRNPAKPLRMTKNRVFNAAHGDRSGIANVVVIFSAQVSAEDMTDTMSTAETMKSLGTSIIWIGFSDAINATAMQMVVSSPPSENFFTVQRLEYLKEYVDEVAVAACRAARNPQNGCVMDLAFLIDHSSSIVEDFSGNYSAEKWNLILNFFQNVVDNLDVGPTATHVASYTFGKYNGYLNFDLKRGQTKDRVVEHIGEIEHKGEADGRNPAVGLDMTRKRIFNSMYGDRSGVPNVVVLISKEVSNDDWTDVMSKAKTMKRLGTSILWIGVSNRTNATAMKMAVSWPSSENFFAVDSGLENLENLADDLAKATCRAAKISLNGCIMDLALLIDYSSSIAEDADGEYSAENWKLILNFLRSLVLTHDVGPSTTHVASTLFGSKNGGGTKVRWHFNDGQIKDEVVTNIGRIYNSGQSESVNDLEFGLALTSWKIFNATNGDRPDVPNVVVIITDEVPNDIGNTIMSQANTLKNLPASIIFIGVSKTINVTLVEMVASEPLSENFFKVSSVENLNSIVNDVSIATCRAVRKQNEHRHQRVSSIE